jgi:hypothetical protein
VNPPFDVAVDAALVPEAAALVPDADPELAAPPQPARPATATGTSSSPDAIRQ